MRSAGRLNALRLGSALLGIVRPPSWAISSARAPEVCQPCPSCFVRCRFVTPPAAAKIATFSELSTFHPRNFNTVGIFPALRPHFSPPGIETTAWSNRGRRRGANDAGNGRRNLDSQIPVAHELPGADATLPGYPLPGHRVGQQREEARTGAAAVPAQEPQDIEQRPFLGWCHLSHWLRCSVFEPVNQYNSL